MTDKYSSLLPNEERSTNNPEKRNKLAAMWAHDRQAQVSPQDAKAAANAVANMKEVDAEVAAERMKQAGEKKYAKGGRVTGYRGYGKARKV